MGKKAKAMVYDLDELAQGLSIDQNNLDEEVERQPELYYRVASLEAQLQSQRDFAKDEMEKVWADQDSKYRRMAEKKGEATTERMIKAKIERSSEYRDTVQGYLELKLKTDKATALKDSFKQRSYMIRDLVELYVAGYFQSSAVTGGVREKSRDQRADVNRKKMAEKRRERDRE